GGGSREAGGGRAASDGGLAAVPRRGGDRGDVWLVGHLLGAAWAAGRRARRAGAGRPSALVAGGGPARGRGLVRPPHGEAVVRRAARLLTRRPRPGGRGLPARPRPPRLPGRPAPGRARVPPPPPPPQPISPAPA